MVSRKQFRWLLAVGMGFVGGMVLSGVWPQTPLYAVATDRVDTFGMATGPVDTQVEAVYFLDFLTGDLRAWVLGKQPSNRQPTWLGYFEYNVAADLGIDPQKNAKYLMTTGMVNLRRAGGSRLQWSASVCYVAEVTSGKVGAYAIPWNANMYDSGLGQNGSLVRAGTIVSFRTGLGPGGGIGPGAVPGGPRKGRD